MSVFNYVLSIRHCIVKKNQNIKSKCFLRHPFYIGSMFYELQASQMLDHHLLLVLHCATGSTWLLYQSSTSICLETQCSCQEGGIPRLRGWQDWFIPEACEGDFDLGIFPYHCQPQGLWMHIPSVSCGCVHGNSEFPLLKTISHNGLRNTLSADVITS